MNFFKSLLILFFILIKSLVLADNHSATTTQEIVDQAKEITKQLEGESGGNQQLAEEEEEDVPLNDPFAGNEGSNSASKANLSEEEQQDEFSLYNYKLSGLISGINHSYITLTDGSGDVITLTLGQNSGNNKLIDLRLTEAIFIKEDKSYLIIDFNNIVREASEY